MNILTVSHNAGLTSCLSVRLHEAARFRREHGQWPDAIDSSGQFEAYRALPGERIDLLLLGDYDKPDGYTEYDHGWQYGYYDEIGIPQLSRIAMQVCRPSTAVLARAMHFRQLIGERTAVLYRGNDKAKEVPPMSYDDVILAAQEAGGPYLLQTDEDNFYQYFTERFPDTIALPDLPRIKRDTSRYVMPSGPQRPEFALNFNAALYAIGQANKVVCTTGNTAIWSMLYRGHVRNVWQLHGHSQTWRKLAAE